MQGRFWLGFLVGLLVGVVTTGVAILLFFVPVRSSTVPADPSSAPAGIEMPLPDEIDVGLQMVWSRS